MSESLNVVFTDSSSEESEIKIKPKKKKKKDRTPKSTVERKGWYEDMFNLEIGFRSYESDSEIKERRVFILFIVYHNVQLINYHRVIYTLLNIFISGENGIASVQNARKTCKQNGEIRPSAGSAELTSAPGGRSRVSA